MLGLKTKVKTNETLLVILSFSGGGGEDLNGGIMKEVLKQVIGRLKDQPGMANNIHY